MDVRTVEKLGAKLNLAPREHQTRQIPRKKRLKEKVVDFTSVYQEMIQREKLLIRHNKYAQELAKKASKIKGNAGSQSPTAPRFSLGSTVDESIEEFKQHIRTLTGPRMKENKQKGVRREKGKVGLLMLDRREVDLKELWQSELPELTAVRYGKYRVRTGRRQGKGSCSPVVGGVTEADTQTPEPGYGAMMRCTIRAVQVSRLGAREQDSVLERRTC